MKLNWLLNLLSSAMTAIEINMTKKKQRIRNKIKMNFVQQILKNIPVHQVAKFSLTLILLFAKAGALAIVTYSGWKCFSK